MSKQTRSHDLVDLDLKRYEGDIPHNFYPNLRKFVYEVDGRDDYRYEIKIASKNRYEFTLVRPPKVEMIEKYKIDVDDLFGELLNKIRRNASHYCKNYNTTYDPNTLMEDFTNWLESIRDVIIGISKSPRENMI